MFTRCVGVVLVLCVGCSGKVSNGSDASSSSDAGTTDGPTTTTGLAGTWVGYIESFKFQDGSDAVTLKLQDNGSGTAFFGPGPALAPPTNPDVGYPPAGLDAREGFAFTILDPSFAAPRLTISIAQSEIFKQWCEIQKTIYPRYNGSSSGGCGEPLGYGCLPNVATQGGTSCAWSSCDHPTWTPVDCGKMNLCAMGSSPCQCTATSCTMTMPTHGGIAFDVQLAANKLDGSVTGLGEVHNVHLTRQ